MILLVYGRATDQLDLENVAAGFVGDNEKRPSIFDRFK